MFDLTNFIPYDSTLLKNGEQNVLVWSKKTGYYFTQMGFVVLTEDTKIIAMER